MHKILIDHNLTPSLSSFINSTFNKAKAVHVQELMLDTENDQAIFTYAQMNQYHILTKDKDFKDIQIIRGCPPKIIWLRIGNCSRKKMVEVVHVSEEKIIHFLDSQLGTVLEIAIKL